MCSLTRQGLKVIPWRSGPSRTTRGTQAGEEKTVEQGSPQKERAEVVEPMTNQQPAGRGQLNADTCA